MAGAGYKLFNTGDVLTAAQVNTYLQQQVIMVFADASARTTALSGVLSEGMFSYLTGTNAFQYYDGAAWVDVSNPGDITAVNVTSPITGGGSSGAVTIGINAATTSVVGAVQLSDSTSTTSSVLASTPTATKSAYDLADAAIPKSTVTTAGDVIYATGSSAVTRLGIGTAGQILAVNSGATAPEWVAAPAAGMTLLSTTTLSGATVTISGISQSYKSLVAFIYGMTNATANGVFRIAPNGATDQSAGVQIYNNGNSASGPVTLGGNGYINTVVGLTRTNAENSIFLQINNYTNAAVLQNYTMNGYIRSSSPGDMQFTQAGSIGNLAAVTSLVFSNAGGNLSTGTVLLYGVN